MNAAEATTLVTAIGAVASSFAVPTYLQRRKEKQRARETAAADATRLAAGTEVTWGKINLRLEGERDRLQDRLDKQSAKHTDEIKSMREGHQQEIDNLRANWEADANEIRSAADAERADMKRRYDERISDLSERLAACQHKLSLLYQEMYELQKLLPPGIAPPTV